MQGLTDPLQLAQLFPEADDRNQRQHEVRKEQGIQHADQNPAQQMGQPADQGENQRMDQPHGERHRKAPHNREAQADIAPQIKGLVGIIPPPGMERLLQNPAADQLHQGTQQHAQKKQQHQIAGNRFQQQQGPQHSHAVNGAHRAV